MKAFLSPQPCRLSRKLRFVVLHASLALALSHGLRGQTLTVVPLAQDGQVVSFRLDLNHNVDGPQWTGVDQIIIWDGNLGASGPTDGMPSPLPADFAFSVFTASDRIRGTATYYWTDPRGTIATTAPRYYTFRPLAYAGTGHGGWWYYGSVGNAAATAPTAPPPSPVAGAATNPTGNSFAANWDSAVGAAGYRLDVSTNNSFSSYVAGNQDRDVGNVQSAVVSGLAENTTYYYRVRAYNSLGTSPSSNTAQTATTSPSAVRLAVQYWQANDFPDRPTGSGHWEEQQVWVDGYFEEYGHWEDQDGDGWEETWVIDGYQWIDGHWEWQSVWVEDVAADGLYGSSWTTTNGIYNIVDATGGYGPSNIDRGYFIPTYQPSQQLTFRAWGGAPAGSASYSAAIYTPSGSYVDSGTFGEWRQFTVNLSQTGTWRIDVSYTNATAVSPTSGTVSYYVGVGVTAQTINFPAISNRAYGDPPFALNATASSGLPVSYAIASGPATVSGNTLTINGSGTITVIASQGGGSGFSPAASVSRSFTVSAPTLAIVGGNNQTAPPSQFNAQPFDVAVWNTAGTQPLVGTAISFTVQSGGGSLATTSAGTPTLSTTLNLTTDAEGTARAYYKQPGSANVASSILAASGGAQLTLTTQSAVGDTTPPNAPSSVTASATTPNGVSFTWSAAVDPGSGSSGVAGYNVFRNESQLNSSLVTSTNYTDNTVAAGASYTYTVKTVDGAGNASIAVSLSVATPSSSTGGSFEVFTPGP